MGIFNFQHKSNSQASNFSDYYQVDIHSHLIPGIDDGAKSLNDSLEIIASLKSLGLKKLITTPHISQAYPNSKEHILEAFGHLKTAVAENNIGIQLELGAEYMVDDGFWDIYKKGDLITFGKNFVLIELNTYSAHPGLSNYLFEMQSSGVNVILAHPERYLYWQEDFNRAKKMKDREVYFQMNILSLTKAYSADIHKLALRLLKEGMIDFIGSDIHSLDYIPKISDVLFDKQLMDLLANGQIRNNSLFL